jgi:UDP-N-acetylglucosamine:LPS N-acetylglucosamine transferase
MRDETMSIAKVCLKKPLKLLILTSSGGGGLIQAANAKEQEIRAKDPSICIARKDVLKDWLFHPLGKIFIHAWNRAQIKGNVQLQALFGWGQFYCDYVLWPNYFCSALLTFFKEDVDRVIDTQPMATSAILTALRLFNRVKGKNVKLEKVLVDLPTKKAIHFFRPIKALVKRNRRLLQLTTIPPLLEEGQTLEEFWQTNCRLSDREISYEDVYVRQSFRQFQAKEKSAELFQVNIRIKNSEELQLMKKTFERGPLRATFSEQGLAFSIAPEERVITILLGSQPAAESTFNYMQGFLQLAKEASLPKTPTHLFIFTADGQGQCSLLRKISDFISTCKDYPSHVSVVPFSFQKDDVIAPLFYRSDLTCTRSGGQTAMELMCVSKGSIWIHSEAKSDGERELSNEALLRGIPGWESANADYLQRIRGAKLVTPETFTPHARALFLASDPLISSSPSLERPLESTA